MVTSHGDTKVAHFLCRCPQFCGSLVFFCWALGGIDAIREIGLGCPGIGESLALGPLAQLLGAKSISLPLSTYSHQVEMLFQ